MTDAPTPTRSEAADRSRAASTYLDHAATTPMLPAAVAAYADAASRVGNASSLHRSGRSARRLVEESRELIADRLGASPSEVVFTGGGTEADNLAVKGLYWGARDGAGRRVVVVSTVEHHAVLDAVAWLERHEGAVVERVAVDEHGAVTVDAVAEALDRHAGSVAVVTAMWANNEVGTVNPIAGIAAACRAAGASVHSDAVQAIGQLPVDFAASGLTAMSMTGHKVGGPVGVGALLLRRDAVCVPLAHGGGQERDVRSGTLDVAGIAALAAAVDHAVSSVTVESARLAALRDDLVARVRAVAPDAVLNGHPDDRLPANAHFSFPGCEGDALLMLLDAAGVECATGSACSAGVAQPSHVLLAMGAGAELARSSLRFSLGRTSTKADVDALVTVLPGVIERARAAGLS